MISIPGSLSFAKLVMTSFVPEKNCEGCQIRVPRSSVIRSFVRSFVRSLVHSLNHTISILISIRSAFLLCTSNGNILTVALILVNPLLATLTYGMVSESFVSTEF